MFVLDLTECCFFIFIGHLQPLPNILELLENTVSTTATANFYQTAIVMLLFFFFYSLFYKRLGNVGTESKQLASKLVTGQVSTNDVKTGAKLGIQLYILYFVGSIVGNGICGVSNAQLGSSSSSIPKQTKQTNNEHDIIIVSSFSIEFSPLALHKRKRRGRGRTTEEGYGHDRGARSSGKDSCRCLCSFFLKGSYIIQRPAVFWQAKTSLSQLKKIKTKAVLCWTWTLVNCRAVIT